MSGQRDNQSGTSSKGAMHDGWCMGGFEQQVKLLAARTLEMFEGCNLVEYVRGCQRYGIVPKLTCQNQGQVWHVQSHQETNSLGTKFES